MIARLARLGILSVTMLLLVGSIIWMGWETTPSIDGALRTSSVVDHQVKAVGGVWDFPDPDDTGWQGLLSRHPEGDPYWDALELTNGISREDAEVFAQGEDQLVVIVSNFGDNALEAGLQEVGRLQSLGYPVEEEPIIMDGFWNTRGSNAEPFWDARSQIRLALVSPETGLPVVLIGC
ncbi:hypothetical protein KC853_03170, partial [Candidatus Saccharibacteria bacterium]|nr:hypothetical protein [Candidatus Saccharibacteria bacterium]